MPKVSLILFFYLALLWQTQGKAQESKDPRTQELIEQLSTGKEDVKTVQELGKEVAIETLSKIGEKSVPFLIEILENDENLFVKAHAAEALGSMGEKAAGAAPVLIKVLQQPLHIGCMDSPEYGLISAIIHALGNIGEKASDAVPVLTDLLHSRLRYWAIASLSQMGEKGIPPLIEALSDQKLQKSAEKALIKVGNKAVPALLEILQQKPSLSKQVVENDVVENDIEDLQEDEGEKIKIEIVLPSRYSCVKGQIAAAVVLWEIKGDEKLPQILSVLVEALKNGDWEVRNAAQAALARLGQKATSILIESFKNYDAEVRYCILSGVAEMGEKGVPILWKALQEQNKDIQEVATQGLGRIGKKAIPAVPDLQKIFKHSSGKLKVAAAEALWKIKGEEVLPKVLPALIEALKDKDAKIDAASALKNIGEKTSIPVPFLIEIFKKERGEIRNSAIWILYEIGEKAETAIPIFIEALKDPDDNIRSVAVRALGRMGEKAEAAIPVLVKTLYGNGTNAARGEAMVALENIAKRTSAPLPFMIDALKDKDKEVRWAAMWILSNMERGKVETAIPVFIQALHDPETHIRRVAAQTLGELGGKAEAAVPTLIQALHDPEPEVRYVATNALGNIGKKPEIVIPALIEALPDSEYYTGAALWQISIKTATAIPFLIRGLKHEKAKVRKTVVEILETMGEKAEDAIPALQESRQDSDKDVRNAVKWALIKIYDKLNRKDK